ncbi:hypothetical protein BDF20DRAFT_836334 [Mycotypha africana]|uniref:uncharacterized protein n=1 Tax=Mycotypha africana TaxID=64632 RepID=UPI002300C233|nr:uncharacterized protein BDF20DRAFT_836334 [Mycotypha africana]KAI8977544.1 hypothetical protein BDF20DRAFT_836334 [Mycotypha africana]
MTYCVILFVSLVKGSWAKTHSNTNGLSRDHSRAKCFAQSHPPVFLGNICLSMGQTDSTLKGSFTFAYSKDLEKYQYNIVRSIEEKQEDVMIETSTFDNVLTHPELYALTTTITTIAPPSSTTENQKEGSLLLKDSSSVTLNSMDTVTSINSSKTSSSEKRPDSGYLSSAQHEEKLELANDLAYIDSTYYSSLHFHRVTATTHTLSANKALPLVSAASMAVKNEEPAEKDKMDMNMNGSGVKFSFADVISASSDKTIREVRLSNRSICQLNPNMGMLTTIRKLDLSNNRLTELPESVGCIQSLEVLCLSRNQLKSIPGTIGYLSNLLELDLSYNKLDCITPCIGYLDKLKTLSLAFNQITRLPTNVEGLINLINLDLTRNPLQILPAEIAKLPFLRRMRLDDCPLNKEMTYSTKHDPPSLLEFCARTIVRNKVLDLSTLKQQQQQQQQQQHRHRHRPISLPQHLIHYIQSVKRCTSCRGPYFESYVLRSRLMEKADVFIPLEYTLCSAHWSTCDDRILSMFSVQPETTSDLVPLPDRPTLPTPSKTVARERHSLLNRRLQRHSTTASCSRASLSNAQTTAVETRLTTVISNNSNPHPQARSSSVAAKLRSSRNSSKRTSTLGRLTFNFKKSNNPAV